MASLAPIGASKSKYNSALYMAFLHMWRKERQGKSGEVGSHARASLYYMVEHWERHLYAGVILRLHTHVGRQLRTDHRHTPRPRKSGDLIEEGDER